MKGRFLLPTLVLSASLFSAAAYAQATSTVSATRGWEWDVSIYVFGSALDGETGIGPVVVQSDVSFSELFENLDMAFMGRAHARRGNWVLGTDVIYADLGVSTETTPVAVIGLDEWIVEFDVGYQLTPMFQSLIGARYVELDSTIDFKGPLGVSASGKVDWWDPYIGGIFTLPIGHSWSFSFRGDIGGFGVGSDESWQIETLFHWNKSQRTSFLMGWRWLDMDYDDDGFLYDMMMQGPEIGVTWRF